MISKRLLIISAVVMIKQKRSRLIEQVQSRHEIVDIEVQFRKIETVNSDFEKRIINVFQKFKRKQTFS